MSVLKTSCHIVATNWFIAGKSSFIEAITGQKDIVSGGLRSGICANNVMLNQLN